MLLPQVAFDDAQQRFTTSDDQTTQGLVSGMAVPLSATFQLTRNCNFKCVYCSEPPGIRTRPLEEVLAMIDKLAGMRRIIFSGGCFALGVSRRGRVSLGLPAHRQPRRHTLRRRPGPHEEGLQALAASLSSPGDIW
jgi:hypothetical protein